MKIKLYLMLVFNLINFIALFYIGQSYIFMINNKTTFPLINALIITFYILASTIISIIYTNILYKRIRKKEQS